MQFFHQYLFQKTLVGVFSVDCGFDGWLFQWLAGGYGGLVVHLVGMGGYFDLKNHFKLFSFCENRWFWFNFLLSCHKYKYKNH